MFLSPQTYEELKIAVYSHIEAIQFLLGEGFQYVLSERFVQDVLEDYFDHQRSKGGRSDNPTAQQFWYNDLMIAAQRDIAPVIRGNFGGPSDCKCCVLFMSGIKHFKCINVAVQVQKSKMNKKSLLSLQKKGFYLSCSRGGVLHVNLVVQFSY